MYHHLLALGLYILNSTVSIVDAKEANVVGRALYEKSVAASKLEDQDDGQTPKYFDDKQALMISQGAIGNKLGEYTFVNRKGKLIHMSEYLGKPLVISMIYTHCPFVCATTTRNLTALKLSRDALGPDSFSVLTVGFDTANDTPEAMDNFAQRMEVKLPNWEFVSADKNTIKKLSRDLGFVFYPSPDGGFDHITQTTFVDGSGVVNTQIYGEEFGTRTLLEPLKSMIYGVKPTDPVYSFKTSDGGFRGVLKSVKLFCTVYDTRTGRYTVDYGFFYGIGMGVLLSILIIWWIVGEYRRSPRRSYPHHG
jgi:protein SCO1/2